MNPQIQYICCHRIKADCSESKPVSVMSVHRKMDNFIKAISEKRGDNILCHEWYLVEIEIEGFTSIDSYQVSNKFDLDWMSPVATLHASDTEATWNEKHPLYEFIMLRTKLSTTV
jgi:hypothetical protein